MVLGIKKQELPEIPGWRFRDAIWDTEGNLSTYIAESPTGRSYFKSDFEKLDLTKPEAEQNVGGSFLLPLLQERLQAGQPIEPEAEALLKQYVSKLPPVKPLPKPELQKEQDPLTQLFQGVYTDKFLPDVDSQTVLKGLSKQAQDNPQSFLTELQQKGRTEDTIQILQMFSAEPLTEEMVSNFFQGQPQITSEQNLLMKALPLIVKPRTLDWAIKHFGDNPDKLHRELITVGRNSDTEALVKSRFPYISEQGLKDYFSADFGEFEAGRKEEWRDLPLPTFRTPAGNTATYKMTDKEWSTMPPEEKDFYKLSPNSWYAQREKWAQIRVRYDRFKIIAEDILGIKVDPQTPLDYIMNVINAEVWVIPIPLVKLIKPLAKVKIPAPGIVDDILRGTREFLTKARSLKKGEVKVAENVAEKIEAIAKEPLPKEVAPISAADALRTEYTELVSRAGSIAPDNATVQKAKGILSKITPENQRVSLRQIEALEDELKGIVGKVTPAPEGIPTMITRDMESRLKAKGITQAEIDKMTPQQAIDRLGIAPPAGKAANIRLDKFNEDIRPVIKDWADTHPIEVQEARRGVISDTQVRQKAEQLVSEVGGDLDKLRAEWKPGIAWNAEELTAIRGALAEKTKAVLDAQKLVKVSSSTENLLKLEMAIREQAAVQETVHGLTAEAGRALRSFRQSFAEVGTDAAKMEALLKRIGRENLEGISERLGALDINDPTAVNRFIQSLSKPRIGDYLTEIYYNSILSGPKTHIVNAMSNTFNAIFSPIERVASASVDLPLSAIQGRPRQRFFSEVPADVFGAIRGIPEGFRQFAHVIKNGISYEQATKWEFQRKAFKGKIGAVITMPSRFLQGADELMKAINTRATLNAEAHRLASIEKLTGKSFENRVAELLSNPPADMLREAEKVAEYRLFRQPLGKTGQALMNARESIDILGLKPIRFVIPFIRTPMNLVKFGLERTPLGLGNPKLWENLITRSPEAADQLARIIIGSAGLASVAWYAKEGKITGAPPRNAAERERFYREGKQPYAIQVGEFWVSYQRLEPFNQLLSQASILVDAINNKEKDLEERITDAANTFGQNFISQTYMSSVSDLLNMLAEPERYGGRWLNRFATAMLVPMSSASRTAAQMLDDTVRDPQNAWETILANIPGVSKNVQAKITALGEDIKRKSPPWFPISVTPVEETVLSQELERLKVNIGMAGTTIKGVKLSDEEQAQYQKLVGGAIKTDLEKLMLAPDYWKASDTEKNKMIDSVLAKARDWASFKMREKMFTTGSTEERMVTLVTALKTADNQLGDTISATPEFSHELPNIYDMAHELDSSYKILLQGIPLSSIKNAPPSVQSWYEKEKALQDTSILRNQNLVSLNADSQKGDTFEDYFKQWQQRNQIVDEMALAEFDKKYPNAQLGNFSKRELEVLRAYYKLNPQERRDFLEKNPGLLSNPKTDWLKSHPKENATLVIWGEGKLLTKEAYTRAQNLIKTLDIPSNALSDFAMPPEGSVDNYFKYQDIENKNSWEAQLMLAKDPDLLEFLGRQPIDTPIASLELKVKNRANFDKLNSFSDEDSLDYIADEKKRAEAIKKLKVGTEFGDDLRKIEAIEKGTDEIPTPDTIIESHVDYMKLQDKEGIGSSSPEVMLFRVDNPEYDQWRQNEVWGDDTLKPVDQYKIPMWRIEVKYKDLFKEHQNILDTTIDIKDQNQKVAQLFDQNPAFKEAYYRRAGYQLRLPEPLVQDYTTYMLIPERGWAKERFLMLHSEFYAEIKKIKGWKTDIKWDKIPTQQVEDKYFVYEGLSPQQKLDYREGNLDLDAWLVLTGKVTKSIQEIKRQKTLTPKQKFEEAVFAGQTEFDKSMAELRKKLGGL